MPEQVVWQFGMQLVTIVVTGLAGWLAGRIKGAGDERKQKSAKEQDERDTDRAVNRLLLYHRMRDMVHDAQRAGYMNDADKHELTEIYDYYSGKYDGNGVGTQVYNVGMALPPSSPSERSQK